MCNCKSVLALLFLLFSAQLGYSQRDTTASSLRLDLNLIDLPYQKYATSTYGGVLKGYGSPSMDQALKLSASAYQLGHFGIKSGFKWIKKPWLNQVAQQAAAGVFDHLIALKPLGHAWLHEEYHRAGFTINGVKSFNEVNEFPRNKPAIYVKHLTDQSLEKLHDTQPAEWRRIMVAGGEGELSLIKHMQADNFFRNHQLPNELLYLRTTLSVQGYIEASTEEIMTELVKSMNQEDGADIRKRDFTGPDYTAWAYSLFRPSLKYADRGLHPSNVGINRYISPQQLTQEETAFVKGMARMSLLNYVSPMMFGFRRIKLFGNTTGNYYGNFAVRHTLTGYGSDLSLDLFYQTPRNNFLVTLHNYKNYTSNFYGIEGRMLDHQLAKNFYVSPTVMLWSQPQNFDFRTSKGTLGGLAKVQVNYRTKYLAPYVELTAKTKGWVMGEPFLNRNFSMKAGVSVIIP